MIDFAEKINLPLIIDEKYGLREFVENVADDINGRCVYCYEHRLEQTAKYASENGFDAFTSTLFASTYQNHEMMKAAAEKYAQKYNIDFFYRDFRPYFKEGNQKAREQGLYMQKYCGCVFSEEDRYIKQINRAKEKYSK